MPPKTNTVEVPCIKLMQGRSGGFVAHKSTQIMIKPRFDLEKYQTILGNKLATSKMQYPSKESKEYWMNHFFKLQTQEEEFNGFAVTDDVVEWIWTYYCKQVEDISEILLKKEKRKEIGKKNKDSDEVKEEFKLNNFADKLKYIFRKSRDEMIQLNKAGIFYENLVELEDEACGITLLPYIIFLNNFLNVEFEDGKDLKINIKIESYGHLQKIDSIVSLVHAWLFETIKYKIVSDDDKSKTVLLNHQFEQLNNFCCQFLDRKPNNMPDIEHQNKMYQDVVLNLWKSDLQDLKMTSTQKAIEHANKCLQTRIHEKDKDQSMPKLSKMEVDMITRFDHYLISWFDFKNMKKGESKQNQDDDKNDTVFTTNELARVCWMAQHLGTFGGSHDRTNNYAVRMTAKQKSTILYYTSLLYYAHVLQNVPSTSLHSVMSFSDNNLGYFKLDDIIQTSVCKMSEQLLRNWSYAIENIEEYKVQNKLLTSICAPNNSADEVKAREELFKPAEQDSEKVLCMIVSHLRKALQQFDAYQKHKQKKTGLLETLIRSIMTQILLWMSSSVTNTQAKEKGNGSDSDDYFSIFNSDDVEDVDELSHSVKLFVKTLPIFEETSQTNEKKFKPYVTDILQLMKQINDLPVYAFRRCEISSTVDKVKGSRRFDTTQKPNPLYYDVVKGASNLPYEDEYFVNRNYCLWADLQKKEPFKETTSGWQNVFIDSDEDSELEAKILALPCYDANTITPMLFSIACKILCASHLKNINFLLHNLYSEVMQTKCNRQPRTSNLEQVNSSNQQTFTSLTFTSIKNRHVELTYEPDWPVVQNLANLIDVKMQLIPESYNADGGQINGEPALGIFIILQLGGDIESVMQHGYKSLRYYEDNSKDNSKLYHLYGNIFTDEPGSELEERDGKIKIDFVTDHETPMDNFQNATGSEDSEEVIDDMLTILTNEFPKHGFKTLNAKQNKAKFFLDISNTSEAEYDKFVEEHKNLYSLFLDRCGMLSLHGVHEILSGVHGQYLQYTSTQKNATLISQSFDSDSQSVLTAASKETTTSVQNFESFTTTYWRKIQSDIKSQVGGDKGDQWLRLEHVGRKPMKTLLGEMITKTQEFFKKSPDVDYDQCSVFNILLRNVLKNQVCADWFNRRPAKTPDDKEVSVGYLLEDSKILEFMFNILIDNDELPPESAEDMHDKRQWNQSHYENWKLFLKSKNLTLKKEPDYYTKSDKSSRENSGRDLCAAFWVGFVLLVEFEISETQTASQSMNLYFELHNTLDLMDSNTSNQMSGIFQKLRPSYDLFLSLISKTQFQPMLIQFWLQNKMVDEKFIEYFKEKPTHNTILSWLRNCLGVDSDSKIRDQKIKDDLLSIFVEGRQNWLTTHQNTILQGNISDADIYRDVCTIKKLNQDFLEIDMQLSDDLQNLKTIRKSGKVDTLIEHFTQQERDSFQRSGNSRAEIDARALWYLANDAICHEITPFIDKDIYNMLTTSTENGDDVVDEQRAGGKKTKREDDDDDSDSSEHSSEHYSEPEEDSSDEDYVAGTKPAQEAPAQEAKKEADKRAAPPAKKKSQNSKTDFEAENRAYTRTEMDVRSFTIDHLIKILNFRNISLTTQERKKKDNLIQKVLETNPT